MKPDFDTLCKNAFAEGAGNKEKGELWRAVFALPQWTFIQRGEIPNVRPYIAQANQITPDLYWLYAFTDTDRAASFAKNNNLTDSNGGVSFLSFPTNETLIPALMNYTEHWVHGIYFNCEHQGFYSPLKQLQPVKTFIDQGEAKKDS